MRIEVAFNGKYICILEKGVKNLQVFHVHNRNLQAQNLETPAAMFLHPLGQVTKFFEVVASDVAWMPDALE